MSLPPPGLPPEVGARTRIKALTADLAGQRNPRVHAALAYEIGALTELRLGDTRQALEHYRDASEQDPSFRPALFAQGRLLREVRDDETLVRVLAKTVRASTAADDRAAALIDLGCLLEDRLADPAGAQHAFERALQSDPRSLAAALMQERTLLGQNRRAEAARLLAKRANHTLDAKLRSVLACEAARELALLGEIEAAVETLLTALALPGRQLATLTTLSELASRYRQTEVAARAFEDLGAMLGTFATGQSDVEPSAIAARFPDAASAAAAAAFSYRTAGRLHASLPDPERANDALLAYERAAACVRGDVLLGLELAEAYEATGAISDARAVLAALLPAADPRRAAALQFQLAELAQRQGEGAAALEHLQLSLSLAPDAGAIAAVLEDRLLDAGAMNDLCDLLAERAERLDGEERITALWRAGLAADRGRDATRAIALFSQLAELVPDRSLVLREIYGVALRGGLTSQLAAAAEKLLACDIDHGERSALLRTRYEAALADDDMASARAMLRRALEESGCDAWAPHAGWLVGALHGDHDLVAASHAKLAEAAEQSLDTELAAGHLAAQSRALLRGSGSDKANAALRRALELSPANAYAVALLERDLLARGETAEAVHLLQDAAVAEQDVRRREAALLHAGALAEAAGRPDLARSSYEEAAARDPGSLAPLWTRLRFAERTHDNPLRIAALQALSEREEAQQRPFVSHLELGDAYAANGQFELAVAPLKAALGNDAIAFEAAASAALLPRGAQAEELRPHALSQLAELTSRQARKAFEHERLAELIHDCPEDARTLLTARVDQDESSHALLNWLSCDASGDRVAALEELSVFAGDTPARADFSLHALRMRQCARNADDSDTLVTALGLFDQAPETLPAALALDEALSADDDADTRVASLSARLALEPPSAAHDLTHALARALLDAGDFARCLALLDPILTAADHDLSCWETTRIAARAAGDYERVVRACDVLASHARGEVRAILLEEAAAVLHERLERADEAEQRLRAALAAVPGRKPAFDRLHDVLVERESLTGLIELLAQRISVTASGPERIDLLYERARILRAGGERDAALACATELLASAPTHPGALGLCAEIHASREDFRAAVAALLALSETEIAPGQKRLALEGAADFLDGKLRDPTAAFAQLTKLVDADLADLRVHVRMVELAQQSGRIEQAAEALMRAAACSRGPQAASFERRAAAYQLSLGQPQAARESLRRALLAHPTDIEAACTLYVNLSVQAEQAELTRELLEALLAGLAREPTDAELLRALNRLGALTQRGALQQLGLFALEALGAASEDEQIAITRLRARLPNAPRAKLDDASFARLWPKELTPSLARFGRAACAVLLERQKDEPERHGLSRRTRVSKRTPHVMRDALLPWLETFGLELSELHISPSERTALYPIARPGLKQEWVMGASLPTPIAREQTAELVTVLAASRLGLLPIAREGLGPAREALFSALALTGRVTPSSDQTVAPLVASKVSRSLRQELDQAAAELETPAAAPATLALATRELGLRACCVASGDLLAAMTGLDVEGNAALATPAARELMRFWLSLPCIELMQTLGTSA